MTTTTLRDKKRMALTIIMSDAETLKKKAYAYALLDLIRTESNNTLLLLKLVNTLEDVKFPVEAEKNLINRLLNYPLKTPVLNDQKHWDDWMYLQQTYPNLKTPLESITPTPAGNVNEYSEYPSKYINAASYIWRAYQVELDEKYYTKPMSDIDDGRPSIDL